MLPAVTKVIVVPEPVALFCKDLIEANIIFEHAFVALSQIKLGEKPGRVAIIASAKLMQVAVCPAHDRLNCVMKLGKREISRRLDAAPDRRLRVQQVNAYAEAPCGVWDREKLRFRLMTHTKGVVEPRSNAHTWRGALC